MKNERRKFTRRKLKEPLYAHIKIVSIVGENVEIKHESIYITELSMGGFKFCSDIELPMWRELVYTFEIEIMSKTLSILGNIVRKEKLKQGFEYGLELVKSDYEKQDLIFRYLESSEDNLIESLSSISQSDERRKYIRKGLKQYLSANMKIVNILGENVRTQDNEILITDISLGGLGFETKMDLPLIKDVILNFETELMGKIVHLHGYIVRKIKIDDSGMFRYGVKFEIDYEMRNYILRFMNEFLKNN